ncbi:MAG: sigma-70 family RNA polymerase sigma factor [Lachnospiraceae bacterium]|nr:sigma-70 family RNA polymerase sigma factor [Lachnospiraceae bacterium]
MEDAALVTLFFERNEEALVLAEKQYGAYCFTIAKNILNSDPDAEECVNDVWLRAWNAIPPARPAVLSSFLGKIARNLAIDRCRKKQAEKRAGGEYALSLEELNECTGGIGMATEDAERMELGAKISAFLRGEPTEARKIFVCRYFYCDSVKDIAARFGISEAKVKSALFRTRGRLKTYLEKEGIPVS